MRTIATLPSPAATAVAIAAIVLLLFMALLPFGERLRPIND